MTGKERTASEEGRKGLLREKRKYVRIEAAVDVLFRFAGEGGGRTYRAVTKDISHSGTCLKVFDDQEEVLEKTGNDLPALELTLHVEEASADVDAHAEPVWISTSLDWMIQPKGPEGPILMGMAFAEMAAEGERVIDEVISRELEKQRESLLE